MVGRRSLAARLRPRYYGWYVVAACNAVAFITWGVGVYSQGVFLAYYANVYGWSRGAMSTAPTLFFVCAGAGGFVVGRLIEGIGPRRVLLLGACVMAAGGLALGSARELWQVYPSFVLLAGGYVCLHTVTLGAIISRWFDRLRSRAMGAATFAASFGGMVLAPLAAAAMDRSGAIAGGALLAVTSVALVVPAVLFVIKDRPEDVGQSVDGEAEDAVIAAAGAAQPVARETRALLREPALWAIGLAYHLAMVSQGGFLVHQVLFLSPSFGFVAAAGVVSATTIAGVVGRLAYTVWGDRWPTRRIMAATFALQAVGMLISATGASPGQLLLGSIVFGLTVGVIVTTPPVIVAECFGRASFSRAYGPVYLMIQLGSAVGPPVLGSLVEATGGYTLGLVAQGIGLIFAALLILRARPGLAWQRRELP
ncbi:MAG: MFS transporter [Chloroflexota bacterium]